MVLQLEWRLFICWRSKSRISDQCSVFKKIKKMNYKLLKPTNLNEIIPFTENNSDQNIIIDLSELEITLKEILPFQKIADTNRGNGTSFVIINTTVDIDALPEEINVVPTLQEAIDIIDMDEMMRELE